MFAMYNVELTQAEVEKNFLAGILNSAPSLPEMSSAKPWLQSKEGLVGELKKNPSDTLFWPYDFDVDFGLKAGPEDFSYIVENSTDVAGFDGDVGGEIWLTETGPAEAFPVSVTGDTCYFRSTKKFEYGGPAMLEVRVKDSEGATSALAHKVYVAVEAQNDAPMSQNPSLLSKLKTEYMVSQTRSIPIKLSAWDVDCSKSQDLNNQTLLSADFPSSCSSFGLKELKLTKKPEYGKLYIPKANCDGGLAEATRVLKEGDSLPLTRTTISQQDIVLCFEGCLGEPGGDNTNPCPLGTEQREDGIVAEDQFFYTVYDQGGKFSQPQPINVTLTSVLETGLPIRKHYTVDENSGFLPISLKGIDLACDDPDTGEQVSNETICDKRHKKFVIKELPPAYQGFFYKKEADNTIITSLPEGGLEIDAYYGDEGERNGTGTIYFKPATGYFNQDYWPLCGPGAYAPTECPDPNDTPFQVQQFGCVLAAEAEFKGYDGPSKIDNPTTCTQRPTLTSVQFQQYTTVKDLEGNVMGKCNATLREGCPVNVVYTLKVGEVQSLKQVGSKIWITNSHDAGELIIPQTEYKDIQPETKFFLKGADGSCISVDSKGEEDTRVLSIKMEVKNSRGQLGLEKLIQSNTVDPGTYSTATGVTTMTLTGSRTGLNQQLCELHYKLGSKSGLGLNSADAVIDIEFQDVSDGRVNEANEANGKVKVIKTKSQITIKFKQDEVTDQGFNILPVVVWSSISAGALLILGACYCCIHCIIRRALAGERAAVWFVRNVLFTHIDPHDEHKLDHELGVEGAAHDFEMAIKAERIRMDRVHLCARFLHVVCPCCCKFDVQKDLPSEEELQLAALKKIGEKIASKHVPSDRERSLRVDVEEDEIFDWEIHEFVDERTGESRNYYYNSKTGASSWTKPMIKIHAALAVSNNSSSRRRSVSLSLTDLYSFVRLFVSRKSEKEKNE